jgi:hypothetical protein
MKTNSRGVFLIGNIAKMVTSYILRKTMLLPFWKGIILAVQAVKLGYIWVTGNERKIRF